MGVEPARGRPWGGGACGPPKAEHIVSSDLASEVWLALAPGHALVELDAATRERLKALGYLGPN